MSYAIITGASSGLGRKMALMLSEKGYSLVITARRASLLNEVKVACEAISNKEVISLALDLSLPESRQKLFKATDTLAIDIVINNAGFGYLNLFDAYDVSKDIDMIQLNILAMHDIFKHYYQKLKNQDAHILNVASLAAYMPGPRMASYYASKAYVLSLTRAVRCEAKVSGYKVNVSALCPGPVATSFQDVAQATIQKKAMPVEKCSRIALRQMFKKKGVIIPGVQEKTMHVLTKIIPTSWILPLVYRIQTKKNKE